MIIQELSQLLKPFLHVDYNTTLGQVKACQDPDGLGQWLFPLERLCWEQKAWKQGKLQSWLSLCGVGYWGCRRRPSSAARCQDGVTVTKGLSDYEVSASLAYASREQLLCGKPSDGSQRLSSTLSTLHSCMLEWNRKETISMLSPET